MYCTHCAIQYVHKQVALSYCAFTYSYSVTKKHWKFQKSIGNSKKALEIPKEHWKFPKSIGNSQKARKFPKKSIGNSKKSLGMALCNVHILLRMEYLKYSVLSHLGKAFDPVYLEMTK